ncbi:succinate dehydrogenase, cytochrome b556 subunit [Paracoccus tegillarcae]|uniref:Succinate dehydrogenase cytochrome b556 subunit n=1 Tax=Paracoccus tegillarcae TaxID=1529068 RepID=A0A2K9ET85_9RHOB|nr:succinate dehydrogenase, cytochrome b556 subunit [Paracoccus tegillarcae]AUH34965.1 succinate dehydrogenase, cytochrome b556 subunit [Paracoccus tegillarcae]
MADVNRGNRPLSPHLQVYKLPIAAVTSILSRVTSVALVVGLLMITWWLVAAVSGPDAFDFADGLLRSWFGFLVMLGATWALIYHALAGIRHLFYDAGIGIEIEAAQKSSWVIIVGSVVLTLLSLILFFV